MSVEQAINRYTADFQDIVEQLPGQSLSWLRDFRAEALTEFSGRGFPSIHEEEWRYTNVSAIEKKRFTSVLTADSAEIDASEIEKHRLQDAWTVVLVNGRFAPQLSDLEGMADEVTVIGMADALETDAERVRKYLGQAVAHTEHGFVAFNGAWFSDGIFIHVPAKTTLTKSLQILHVVSQPELLATTRNLLVVDAMAEAQVIETYVGADQAYLTATVSEVFVAENAGLTLYKMQTESDKAYHFGGTYVKQARDSRFRHDNFAFGGLLARNDIHSDLDVASECDLNGLYLGGKRQHLDNHTRINHLKPHGISREQYKGVLAQRSRGVFQGRVVVAEDAQKTDSEMNNRNLLLSDDAEADTKPQLEIYADDVKCAHGVTVGQLDEKSIFYLQSRSIDVETARNMLTFAFANEMVNKIKIKSLHDLVLAHLLRRFPQQGIDMNWL
ncbi:Fe-S cluster assembly protein SufD [Methylomarinum sp. Ch1-1]|uniref:Fe-S cluster assembly protein SufD n=1 Tax=Methylomarinum roseum TaxID=3067653 RepID=A0AAU7NRP9_9GAMM|nr:Fe-S cluster assembly protein SufD [Methylomarinum sp. Ch1-1]MDP4520378.1 Fe-S cluster assembly protein SufD [Methylomarinum sp. Ch1-1]